MKLTPIKIRGRGRKQPWQPPNPERFKRKHHNEDDGYGEETGVIPSQVDKNGVKRRRRIKTRKPAALIEHLPPEILERIFSMSENLNFPRSSLRIGYMLSARTFLLQLIVDAFSPTWDMWFGCPRWNIMSYRGYEKDGERMGGNAEFQTSIISSKWLTLSLLLHAQQIWIRRQQQNGLSRLFVHTENWFMIGPRRVELDLDLLISGENPASLNQPNYPHHPHHHLHFDGDFFSDDDSSEPSSSQSNRLDVETCFEADWSWFTTILPQFDPFGIHYGIENREKRTGYWDTNPDTKIPNHLLANPVRQGWESVKLLYWLVRGGATLGGEQTWELTKLGYERLMSHPDHVHPPSSSPNPSQQHNYSQEERELQSLTSLRLFSILGIFESSHWPHFLITEKLVQISAERKKRRRIASQSQSQSQSQHSSQGSQGGYELWKCAQGVLRYWVQQREDRQEN